MYCKFCGRQIASESTFCPYCNGQLRPAQSNLQYSGKQQNQFSNQQQRPLQHSPNGQNGGSDVVRRKKKIAWILGGIWLVVLILLIILIFTKCAAKNDEEVESGESVEEVEEIDSPEPNEVTDPEKKVAPPDPDPDLPLVSNAFYDDSHKIDSSRGVFAIPQINLSGKEIEAINSEIYNTYYLGFAKDALSSWDDYYEYGIIYDWAKNGDVLSLVIEAQTVPYEYTEYDIYNISISEGRRMSDSEVIGLSSVQNYKRDVKEAMETYVWETYDVSTIREDKNSVQVFNQVLESTRTSENIDRAKPYFDYRGDLCAVCYIYSMAGAEGYYNKLNLQNFYYKPEYAETMKYEAKEETPKTNPVKAPSSEYIIAGSDSRLVTRADLVGLTEHETWLALDELYARHGRTFGNKDISDYFNSLSWYRGYIDGDTFDKNLDKYMNAVEKANIDIIADYQREMGWRD